MCRRGDIYKVDFGIKAGSCVQGGMRPVLVISNEMNNKYSPTVTIIKLTGQKEKGELTGACAEVIGYDLPKPRI